MSPEGAWQYLVDTFGFPIAAGLLIGAMVGLYILYEWWRSKHKGEKIGV